MRVAVSFVVLAGLALPGCGKPAVKLVPVTGTVTYQGKPLADARVYFASAEANGPSAKGKTDGSGNYKLKFPDGRDGAVPGKYKVTFSKKESPGGKTVELPALPSGMPDNREDEAGKETLPDHLVLPTKTKVEATVPDKGGTVDIEAK